MVSPGIRGDAVAADILYEHKPDRSILHVLITAMRIFDIMNLRLLVRLVYADRTLGGLCDWVEAAPHRSSIMPV